VCVICIHTKTKVEDLRGAGLIVEDVIEARGDGADLWGLVPDKRLGIEQIGQLGGERATLLILTLVTANRPVTAGIGIYEMYLRDGF